MNRVVALAAIVVIALVACAGDDVATDDEPDDPGPAVIVTTTTTTTTTAPTTTTTATGPESTEPEPIRPPTTEPPATEPPATEPPEPPAPPAPIGDPDVRFSEVVRLDRPIGLARRPDDPTLYLVEQPGRVTAVDPDSGRTRTVLDVTARTAAQGERGLLGLTFSLDGALAYTNHSDRETGATIITEFVVDADESDLGGTFDRDSGRVLLEIDQPFGNHNGGHLVTGPDGLLYIGMGDGGSGGDPERLALDLRSPHGSILRIDPTPSAALPYTVPDDNPFLDVDGAVPETFAIGLRNPWKFEFDPVTGDLWIADVGQNEIEEVNFVAAPDEGVAGAGLSFGWSAFEGTRRFNTDVDPEGHTDPVLTYDHSQGECSISGGAPYRGEAIPDLVGGYVYSDYCSGRVWALDLVGERNLLLGDLDDRVTAVLPGPDLELYVLSHDGPVYRIVPAPAD